MTRYILRIEAPGKPAREEEFDRPSSAMAVARMLEAQGCRVTYGVRDYAPSETN